MAIVNCPECNQSFSDLAAACPKCACPTTQKPVVIEQTSKKWKKLQLIGMAMIIVGMPVSCSIQKHSPTIGTLGILVAGLGGIIVLLYASISIWWHHR